MGDCARTRSGAVAGLIVLLWSASVAGAELRHVTVDRNEDLYRLQSVTWFGASREALYRVLTDYDLFDKFTSAIVESRNVDPDDEGRPRFFTRMEGCVLLFCKSFIRNGHLELEPHLEIVAIVDPARSDFKRSRERWLLIPDEDGTVLVYEFEMVPDFWVPPVIGPYYIMKALKAGGEKAVDRIEALAIAEDER